MRRMRAAVKRALDERGWTLTHILVTHHHADHTAGIPALKRRDVMRRDRPQG